MDAQRTDSARRAALAAAVANADDRPGERRMRLAGIPADDEVVQEPDPSARTIEDRRPHDPGDRDQLGVDSEVPAPAT